MDKDEIDRKVDEYEASRPGPKTLVGIVIVGLCIAAYYNWPVVKGAMAAFQ
jgi:hypothetical protein